MRILPGYSGGTAGLAGEASDGACSPAASSLFSSHEGT